MNAPHHTSGTTVQTSSASTLQHLQRHKSKISSIVNMQNNTDDKNYNNNAGTLNVSTPTRSSLKQFRSTITTAKLSQTTSRCSQLPTDKHIVSATKLAEENKRNSLELHDRFTSMLDPSPIIDDEQSTITHVNPSHRTFYLPRESPFSNSVVRNSQIIPHLNFTTNPSSEGTLRSLPIIIDDYQKNTGASSSEIPSSLYFEMKTLTKGSTSSNANNRLNGGSSSKGSRSSNNLRIKNLQVSTSAAATAVIIPSQSQSMKHLVHKQQQSQQKQSEHHNSQSCMLSPTNYQLRKKATMMQLSSLAHISSSRSSKSTMAPSLLHSSRETVQRENGSICIFTATSGPTTEQHLEDTARQIQESYPEAAAVSDLTPNSSSRQHKQQCQTESNNGDMKFKRIIRQQQPSHNDQQQHSKHSYRELKDTPLMKAEDAAKNQSVVHQKSLNNLYLKMLDEFAIPYEQDFDKIQQKLQEMKLTETAQAVEIAAAATTAITTTSGSVQSSADLFSHNNSSSIDKKFVMSILQSQLESKKVENLKSKQLRVPTNRYDVELLKQWLDFMVFKIYSEAADSGFDLLQKVSVDCKTRGDLLEKVWRNQCRLHIRQVEEEQKFRRQIEQEGLDEITRIHKMYSEELSRLNAQIKILTRDNNSMQEKVSVMKTNSKYLKKNNQHVNKQCKIIRQDLDYETQRNGDIVFAFEELKKEYENIAARQQSMNMILLEKEQEEEEQQQIEQAEVQKTQLVVEKIEGITSEMGVSSNYSSPRLNHKELIDGGFQAVITPSTGFGMTSNNIRNVGTITANNDDSDDSCELMTLVVVEKAVDTQDWLRLYGVNQEVMTDIGMNEMYARIDGAQSEKEVQVDRNVQTELGIVVQVDREVQTTDLDPEYHQRLMGIDVHKLEKEMDNLAKVEDSYKSTIEKYVLPFDVRKAVHMFIQQLAKNADSMQNLMKEEIGLKEKYHRELVDERVQLKETLTRMDDLRRKGQVLEEKNTVLASENKSLIREISGMLRKRGNDGSGSRALSNDVNAVQHDNNRRSSSFMAGIVEKTLENSGRSSRDAREYVNQLDELADTSIVVGTYGKERQSSPSLLLSPLRKQRKGQLIKMKSALVFQQQLDASQSSMEQSDSDASREGDEEEEELLNGKSSNKNGSSSNNNNNNNRASSSSDVINKSQQKVNSGSLILSRSPSVRHRMSIRRQDSNSKTSSLPSMSSKTSLVFDKIPPNLKATGNSTSYPNTSSNNNNSSINNNSNNWNYKFNEPKFERKRQEKTTNPNMGSSMSMLKKILKRMSKRSAKMTMTWKNVSKYISLIYSERLKSDTSSRSDPFHLCCYDFFTSHFGLKRVAESKIIQLYEAVFFFKLKSPRIKLFGAFLGFFDEYSDDELDFYLGSLQKLDEESPPFVQALTCTAEIVYVLHDKLIALLKRTDDGTGGSMESVIRVAGDNKVPLKSHPVYSVVDVDLILDGVMSVNKKNRLINKNLEDAFSAFDLNGDGLIGVYEFTCLCRYIELIEEKSERMRGLLNSFIAKCESINTESSGYQSTLSMEQFCAFAQQNALFSSEKVDKFIQKQQNNTFGEIEADSTGIMMQGVQSFNELRKQSSDILNQLWLRLNHANSTGSEPTEFTDKAISQLSEAIHSAVDVASERSAWLTYIVLDAESKKALLDREVNTCLSEELQAIQQVYRR